jgi:hypothetical protein
LPALLRAAQDAERLSVFAEQAQLLAQALNVWIRVADAQRLHQLGRDGALIAVELGVSELKISARTAD